MTTPIAPATHEEIINRAFLIWCQRGRRPDTADENWHAAERELRHEREHQDLSDTQEMQDAADRAEEKRG